MAYYDISIEKVERILSSLDTLARDLYTSGEPEAHILSRLLRESIIQITETRDRMVVSNYKRGLKT